MLFYNVKKKRNKKETFLLFFFDKDMETRP